MENIKMSSANEVIKRYNAHGTIAAIKLAMVVLSLPMPKAKEWVEKHCGPYRKAEEAYAETKAQALGAQPPPPEPPKLAKIPWEIEGPYPTGEYAIRTGGGFAFKVVPIYRKDGGGNISEDQIRDFEGVLQVLALPGEMFLNIDEEIS